MTKNNQTIIDICICTFRRPQIADTLKSISELTLDNNYALRVIVADNNETTEAQETITNTAKNLGLDLTYVHAPACNISIARNACLDNVTSDIVVFIDDDEIATKSWLKELLTTFKEGDAPIVLGAVKAIYQNDAPKWMVKEDFHSTHPIWRNGEIISGYTCNVLLDYSVDVIKKSRFRVDLGQTGGEDSAFFTNLYNQGCKISFSQKSILTEIVASNRACLSWLTKTRFRMGQTHAMLLLENNQASLFKRIKNIINAGAKACFCFIMALINIIRPSKMVFWFLRGILHVGVISRMLGGKVLKQYGQGNCNVY